MRTPLGSVHLPYHTYHSAKSPPRQGLTQTDENCEIFWYIRSEWVLVRLANTREERISIVRVLQIYPTFKTRSSRVPAIDSVAWNGRLLRDHHLHVIYILVYIYMMSFVDILHCVWIFRCDMHESLSVERSEDLGVWVGGASGACLATIYIR